MQTIILGPPGTGKTTRLLQLVEQYLEKGALPKEIGYFAFTKRAANEAINRACVKFNFEKDELKYFQTLHSFAFRTLGINKDKVMNNGHYRHFGKLMGTQVEYASHQSEESDYFSSDSEYLSIIELAKARGVSTREQFDQNEHAGDVEWHLLEAIDRGLKQYKLDYGLLDFSDMLTQAIENATFPRFKVIFIDEAQDLSHLQWKLVQKLTQHSEDVYIAGDDDQAIFRWAGADVEHFRKLNGHIEVLKKSYRVPQVVHELSQVIVNRIEKRRQKEWLPHDELGAIYYYNNHEEIDMSKGQWLILARTNYLLEPFRDRCEQAGWFYQYRHNTSANPQLLKAIRNWTKWKRGEIRLPYSDINSIYSYMTVAGGKIKHGYKQLKTMDKDNEYNFKECLKHYGLLTQEEWYEAFDSVTDRQSEYIRAMLRNGEDLKQAPRITISTIHAAKGGESTNVVLLPQLTATTEEGFHKNPDDEHRLYYVGVTRTKKTLHIVEPENPERTYHI